MVTLRLAHLYRWLDQNGLNNNLRDSTIPPNDFFLEIKSGNLAYEATSSGIALSVQDWHRQYRGPASPEWSRHVSIPYLTTVQSMRRSSAPLYPPTASLPSSNGRSS